MTATCSRSASSPDLARALAALALSACSGSVTPDSPSSSDGGMAEVGSINAEFRLPSGTVSTASYTLTGPNGYSLASMLDFAGSQAVGFLINSVPAGQGYMLSLSASDADGGGESCTASTTFDVAANKTTMASLAATCTGGPYVPTGYGNIDAWVSPPPSISLTGASYSLTGPAGIEGQGPLKVNGTGGLHFGLQMVPAGTGQVLSVVASGANGLKCEIMATVNVVANQTAEAMLDLQCR